MKNRISIVFTGMLSLFTAASFAQSQPFTINGKLVNISPMPAKMYLTSMLAGMLKQDKDSAVVVNGEYHFKGELNVDEAVGVFLSASAKPESSKDMITFYLDKGELNVVSNDTLKNIIVSGSGSSAHQQFEAIKAGVAKEKEELKRMSASEAYKTSETMQAEVLKRSQLLGFKGVLDSYQLVKNNPDNRLSPFMTYALSNVISIAGRDTLVQLLPARVKADRLGQAIAHIPAMLDSLMKAGATTKTAEEGKIAVGTKAPEFTQPNPKGKSVSLSSFKGKYVLVDFWASWCAPCRAENPNVVKAYHQYKAKGFTVLGVSLDSGGGKAAWLKAIASDGLTWTQISDLKGWKNEAAALYGVTAIPQNFLIDPNGIVIATNLRGEDLQKKLATIFK